MVPTQASVDRTVLANVEPGPGVIGTVAWIQRAEVHDVIDVVLLFHGELLDLRVLLGDEALDFGSRGGLHPEYSDLAITG